MRMPRVFEPQSLTPGAELELGEFAVQHLVRALRLGPGARVRLFDGEGSEAEAELIQVGKRSAVVRILQPVEVATESPLFVELGQGLSRGERMDYAVQKATELGVSRIVPILSERCEVRLSGDRQEKRTRHFRQVAISAAEQCGRARVPEVTAPQGLEAWLDGCDAKLRLVLHPEAAEPLAGFARPASVALLIGPEGGLSDAEVGLACSKGFVPVALGPRVLRTETAPVAALSLLQYLWGDMG